MLKVFVCDDEKNQRDKVIKILKNIILMEDYDMDLVLDTGNPHDVIEYLDNNQVTGLYFLDIDLETDINGIELARKIRDRDPRGFIVFVTNHVDLSVDSFKYRIEAMDFISKEELLKSSTRINKCLEDAMNKYSNKNTSLQKVFSLKTNGRLINIAFDEIIYIETTEHKHKLRLRRVFFEHDSLLYLYSCEARN